MKVILLTLLITLSTACATWRGPAAKTLNVAHNSVRIARLQAAIVCKPVVVQCIVAQTNPCPALNKCFDVRRKLMLVLESTESAVKLGYEALEISSAQGGKEVALSAVAVATESAAEVMALVKKIREGF